MFSSPRFRRGTSVIAALVFAAVLGAIALSLNTLRPSSANTIAMAAQASAPADATEQSCQEGYDYNLTVGGSFGLTNENLPQTQLGKVQMCPTAEQALADARAKYLRTDLSGQEVGTLPPTITEPPLAQRTQCSAASQTKTSIQCNYKLNGSSYQLQTALTGKSGPWTCHVNFFDPNGTTNTEKCWDKDVPLGNGVNDSSPGSPGSGAIGTVSSSSPTVTPSTGLGSTCATNGASCGAGLVCSNYQCVPSTIGTIGCQAGSTMESGVCVPTTQTGPVTSCTGVANGTSCSTSITGQSATCQSNVCTPATTVPPPTTAPAPGPVPAPSPAPAPTTQQPTNGAGNALNGLFSGLVRGLTASLAPCGMTPGMAPGMQNPYVGGNGTAIVPVQTVNAYGQLTTTYVQQPTATGYGSPYGGYGGYGAYGGMPCGGMMPQQQAPYGTGSDGSICPAPPAMPQCAAGATPQPTSANGNGCTTGYQCVPTNSTIGQTPTPSISCSPQVADVGQSVAISYSCTNATGSSASGFTTNNQTSGSASVTIQTPPSGTNTANFGLTCTNNGQNASQQCKVQINQPAIDLIADPQSVASGSTASIGWVTAGMQSCTISSPDDSTFTQQNANSTNVNGVAQTDAITQKTEFDLTCTTLGGQTKKASTFITTGAATSTGSSSVTASSSADGQTVNHGGTVTITWSDAGAASSTADAIWLIDLATEQATALIAQGQATSGTYTWNVPVAGSSCDATTYNVCGADLVAGHSYGIEVAEYTPTNAYLGPQASAPSGAVSPTYSNYGFTSTPFTIGQ